MNNNARLSTIPSTNKFATLSTSNNARLSTIPSTNKFATLSMSKCAKKFVINNLDTNLPAPITDTGKKLGRRSRIFMLKL